MSRESRRSYVGAPRVYLTHGLHEDGEWKRMWFVSTFSDRNLSKHFWSWREAIEYALSIDPPVYAHKRKVKK